MLICEKCHDIKYIALVKSYKNNSLIENLLLVR